MDTSIFFRDFKMQKKAIYLLYFIADFYILIGYIEKHLDIIKCSLIFFRVIGLHNQRVENIFFPYKDNFKTIYF